MAIVARWLAGPLSFLRHGFMSVLRIGVNAGMNRAVALARERAEQSRGARQPNAPRTGRARRQPEPPIPVIDPCSRGLCLSTRRPVQEPPVHHDIPIHELEYQPPPPSSSRRLGRNRFPSPTPEPAPAPSASANPGSLRLK